MILGRNFDFLYQDGDGRKFILSGVITGVKYPKDGGGRLMLCPLCVFIGEHQIHCFRYTGDDNKWIAVLAPKLGVGRGKIKWPINEVPGKLKLIS